MQYWEEINSKLKPWIDTDLNKTVVDLFAGCGGLSLGFEANGFKTIGYEIDENASKTYNENLIGECFNQELTTETIYPKADIVIGGPPCQPFSVGGKQLGLEDSRDGFPIFISAIKQLNPEVLLFENVRGMLYKNKWYLKEVIEELEKLGYYINYALLNAKNYEVPQNRERVIVIGSKKKSKFPIKTNKKDLWRPLAAQDYVWPSLQSHNETKFIRYTFVNLPPAPHVRVNGVNSTVG